MYTTNTIFISVPNDLGVYFYHLLLTCYGQDIPRRFQTAWSLHNITVHMLPDGNIAQASLLLTEISMPISIPISKWFIY